MILKECLDMSDPAGLKCTHKCTDRLKQGSGTSIFLALCIQIAFYFSAAVEELRHSPQEKCRGLLQ